MSQMETDPDLDHSEDNNMAVTLTIQLERGSGSHELPACSNYSLTSLDPELVSEQGEWFLTWSQHMD